MRLRRADGVSAGSLELHGGSLTLVLDRVGDDVELVEAALAVTAVSDAEVDDLALSDDGVAVASSAGPGDAWSRSHVSWVSIVWSHRRTIEGIDLRVDDSAEAARIEVMDGGPWYPATHAPVRLSSSALRLPSVVATGLLLRFVGGDAEDPSPVEARVESLRVMIRRRPLDLGASVGDGPSLASHANPFAPAERWCVRERLAAALQGELVRQGSAMIHLRSSAPCHLAKISLDLETRRIIRTWVGGARERLLRLSAGEIAVARLRLPPGAPPEALSLRASWTAKREHALELPTVREPRNGHRVRPGWTFAQRIDESPGAPRIIGVDLHVRVLSERTRGRVWLAEGRDGLPGAAESAEATFEASAAGERPSHTWLSVDVSADPSSRSGTRWILVQLDEGELLWTLVDRSTAAAEGAGAYYRREGEDWVQRRRPFVASPDGDAPVALVRPRYAASSVAGSPSLSIRVVGAPATELALEKDSDGALRLPKTSLETLRGEVDAAPLEVVARAQFGGELRLFDLSVPLATQRETLTTTARQS